MRYSPWSVAIAGLAVGALAIVGGTAFGGDMGPLTAGYGLLMGLAALYAIVGLAARDRARRRLGRPEAGSRPETVAGHRLF